MTYDQGLYSIPWPGWYVQKLIPDTRMGAHMFESKYYIPNIVTRLVCSKMDVYPISRLGWYVQKWISYPFSGPVVITKKQFTNEFTSFPLGPVHYDQWIHLKSNETTWFTQIFCYNDCYKGIGFEVLRLRIQGQVFMTRNEASNLLLEWAQELDQQLSKVYTRPTLVMTWTYTQWLWWSGMLFSPTWSLSLSLSLSPPVSRLQSWWQHHEMRERLFTITFSQLKFQKIFQFTLPGTPHTESSLTY
jgi:hypothetical protein